MWNFFCFPIKLYKITSAKKENLNQVWDIKQALIFLQPTGKNKFFYDF